MKSSDSNQPTKKKIEELEAAIEKLEKAVAQQADESTRFFEKIGLTPQMILAALGDETRFSPEDWARIQEKKKEWEEELELRMKAMTAPKPTTQLSQIAPFWIHVR